jgi:hypothetical protein
MTDSNPAGSREITVVLSEKSRLSRRERGVWAGFVLLFGVPGCAGFLLHRRWPVREPCPHCQARVARDRDTCAECGMPFPVPVLKGIEIFA